MRLTTVGTGTVAPHPTRVASGHLIQTDDVTLLLDCGPGLTHRLAGLGLPWPAITHVAITHFHLDHVGELAALCYAFKYGQLPPRSAPLTLIGPPGTQELLDRLAIAHGTWLHAPGYPLQVIELPREGGAIRLGTSVWLRTFPVPHTEESVAYSVETDGRRVVYSGDTGYDTAFAQWAAGCDLLLLECSLPESLAIPLHLTPRQVGAMASIATPRRLVLTHFYAPVETEDLVATVAAAYPGGFTLAYDGWAIDL